MFEEANFNFWRIDLGAMHSAGHTTHDKVFDSSFPRWSRGLGSYFRPLLLTAAVVVHAPVVGVCTPQRCPCATCLFVGLLCCVGALITNNPLCCQ